MTATPSPTSPAPTTPTTATPRRCAPASSTAALAPRPRALELVVVRPAPGERLILDEAVVDPAVGLQGDSWDQRGSSRTPDGGLNPEAQVTVMSAARSTSSPLTGPLGARGRPALRRPRPRRRQPPHRHPAGDRRRRPRR
ncbi:MAG: hypothetical protein U0R76_00765 [Candidatus Nanopelagicales bacterium]